MNASHETETALHASTRMTHGLYNIAIYGVGFWLGWTLVGELFPRQKRAIEYELGQAAKRLRP